MLRKSAAELLDRVDLEPLIQSEIGLVSHLGETLSAASGSGGWIVTATSGPRRLATAPGIF